MRGLYIYKIRIKHFFKELLKLKFKKQKMSGVQLKTTYKVKPTPIGKQSSNGPGTVDGECTIKIIRKNNNNNCDNQLYTGLIQTVSSTLTARGYRVGGQYTVYDYELVLGPCNKEAIEKEIELIIEKRDKIDKEIEELNTKITWMTEVGVEEFDEDEYKVYTTLTLLEDPDISKIKKMREIAKLVKH